MQQLKTAFDLLQKLGLQQVYIFFNERCTAAQGGDNATSPSTEISSSSSHSKTEKTEKTSPVIQIPFLQRNQAASSQENEVVRELLQQRVKFLQTYVFPFTKG